MIIYALTSPSNKTYVGQTTRSLEVRVYEHRTRNGSTINNTFQKYPNIEEWRIEILEYCNTSEELNQAEIRWIKDLDTYKNGYNDSLGGGNYSREHNSEEHNKNISEARKAYFETPEGQEWKQILSERLKYSNPSNKGSIPHNKGKKQSDYMSPEQIEQWRDGHKNREYTDEYRATQSERVKEMWASGVFANRPSPSPESVQKRIATQKARGFKQTEKQRLKVSEAHKSTYKVTWEDGTEEIVRGMKEFAVSSKIPYSTLSYCVTMRKGSKKWGIKSIEIISSTKRISKAKITVHMDQ